MKKIPISAVWPLQAGVLQIIFGTGSTAIIDLLSKFQTARFCPLREEEVWQSAETDGQFIRWYRVGLPVVEIACDELLGMIVGKPYY